MLKDVDGWATLLWLLLPFLAFSCARPGEKSTLHIKFLLATSPGILVFMIAYALVRTDDAWCFAWGVAGATLAAPVVVVTAARLTALLVVTRIRNDALQRDMDAQGHVLS